jgi:predicted lysophospholipase L1 biosynthesis ABC-type transport system permease subunit
MTDCPSCGSERIRRGGRTIWLVYLILIVAAVPAVVVFHLHAGLIAAIMLAAIVLAHLLFGERVCLDCGTQWRGGGPG